MTLLQNLKSRLAQKRIAWLIPRNTMVGPERIPGDVVECGVCKGGTAAILARSATRSPLARTVWLFDTFQGMPPATSADGPEAPSWVGNLSSSPRHVKNLLRHTGANLSRVRIIPGLFQDTFPAIHIPQIALLNIDPDWYESVKLWLETFYNVVVSRGFISIDDYGAWPGCRRAVDELFQSHALSYPLQRVDQSAHWFQKS